MDSLQKAMSLVEALEKDKVKVEKGQKAACRRSRVNAMKLIKQLKDYRVELLAKYKK